MINILSGWGGYGGSTEALYNLTVLFNKNGFETNLFCYSDFLYEKEFIFHPSKLNKNKSDIYIIHFLNFDNRFPVEKMFFSCHEHDIFELKYSNYKIYNKIHFVSKHQKQYHNINHPSFVIPNPLPDLKKNKKKNNNAGIIGSIDKNKNIHTSIQRAIADGCDNILIYGGITDNFYFNEMVKPLIDKYKNIQLMGFCEDKQKMYDSVKKVYQDSIMETWGYVKAECWLTDTEFLGNKATEKMQIWNNEKILEHWVKELGL
jgi:hypothetical protein